MFVSSEHVLIHACRLQAATDMKCKNRQLVQSTLAPSASTCRCPAGFHAIWSWLTLGCVPGKPDHPCWTQSPIITFESVQKMPPAIEEATQGGELHGQDDAFWQGDATLGVSHQYACSHLFQMPLTGLHTHVCRQRVTSYG